MRRLLVINLTTFLVFAVASFAADPTADETDHELRTLAQYPKDVREAILELVSHPALLKKLDEKGTNLDKALEGANPAEAAAARLVAKDPEVLKLLKDNPDVFAGAEKAYGKDKKKALEQMDQHDKDDEKAIDEWSQRLDADQEALEQLQEASAAFIKEKGGKVEDSGISTSGEDVNIYSQPSPAFINYAMANADKYPALSNTMTSQWLSSKNCASYDRTFHHWWGNYQNHFHDSLLKPDADRASRLGELAKFDRAHAGTDRAHRYDDFHNKHGKDFPHLNKLPKHDPDKHKPLTGMHQKPDHKDPHAAGKGPHNKGKTAHKVHRKPQSHAHKMHHAKAGHQHHASHHGGHKK